MIAAVKRVKYVLVAVVERAKCVLAVVELAKYVLALWQMPSIYQQSYDFSNVLPVVEFAKYILTVVEFAIYDLAYSCGTFQALAKYVLAVVKPAEISPKLSLILPT